MSEKKWESIPENLVREVVKETEETKREKSERLKEPMGGKVLVCEKSFGGFNIGDTVKTSNKNGEFKIKLFDLEKNKLVKDEDWIKVNAGEDFEDFSNSFVLEKKEKSSESVSGREKEEQLKPELEQKKRILEQKEVIEEEKPTEKLISEIGSETEIESEESKEQSISGLVKEALTEKKRREELLQIDKLLSLYKDRGRFLFHLENLKMSNDANENELASAQTKISEINYNIKNLCRGMTKSDIEGFPENKRREIEEIINAIEEGKMDYGKLAVREKNKIEPEPETPEEPEIKVEQEKEPKTTREVIEQLGLLEELEVFERILIDKERNLAEIENYINNKKRGGEEITQEDEDRRNKASEEVQRADINIATTKGVGASLEVEKDVEDEDRILNKKLKLQDLLWKQYNVLGKIKGIEDKNIEKLSSQKQGTIRRHSSAVINKGLEVFKRLIYEDNDQQVTEPEKKSKFDWLKEKLRIGGKKEEENIGEINEKINNAIKLEDLAGVADFIEEKCGIKFKHSFKKSLRDESSEVLRRNYNSAIEVINGFKEESKKDALIKFYEKLDELLKEKERENNPVDIIEDLLPIEEIEPTELTPETPEIETLETEEISEADKKDMEQLLNDNEIERINNAKDWSQLIREIENRKIKASANLDNPAIIKIHEMLGIILDNFDLNKRELKKTGFDDNLSRLNEFRANCSPEINNNKNVNKFISEALYKISTLLAKETGEKKETGEITEDMNREYIEKEINAFLEKDELNIDNVKSLEDLKNLLGSLETEVKNISKKKISDGLTYYGLRIIESKIEDNHFTYCLEGKGPLAIDPMDIKENFSKDRNLAKDFEIDSLKEYYLELLDKVEELYNVEMKKGKEETGEITEEMKESIRKKLVRMKEELTDFNENIEGFINRFSNSKKLFGEEFSELWFNTFFEGDASIEFKEIKNIKIKDFMAALKKIYDEIEKEK